MHDVNDNAIPAALNEDMYQMSFENMSDEAVEEEEDKSGESRFRRHHLDEILTVANKHPPKACRLGSSLTHSRQQRLVRASVVTPPVPQCIQSATCSVPKTVQEHLIGLLDTHACGVERAIQARYKRDQPKIETEALINGMYSGKLLNPQTA